MNNYVVILQKQNTAEIRAIGQLAMVSDNIKLLYADIHDLPNYLSVLQDGAIPIGSVEFVSYAMDLLKLNRPFNPYPLELYYGRLITLEPIYAIPDEPIFLKPKKLKQFNGFVFKGFDAEYDDHDQEQMYILESLTLNTLVYTSEVINIVAEWRLYFSEGKLLGCCRYDSNDTEFMYNGKLTDYAPDFNFISECRDAIANKTIAVDIGLLRNDEFVVIECNDAWAIGKYIGITNQAYFQFLCKGWQQILDMNKCN